MRGLTPERWQRIEELFDQAIELPAAERAAWLDQACAGDDDLRARVAELLKNEEAAGTKGLIAPVSPAELPMLEFEGRQVPRRLGPYELLDEIGRGGMGAVYKARRVDAEYRSTVAIKLVRPGMDAEFVRTRFRRERQTLAKLSHPNIARLLDGGTSEPRPGEARPGETGIPYIVMEYISGTGISQYCRARRLSVAERVALFLPIIAAVDYAHRNFVIHRDIKPGNILVDQDGVPKLLDFGICKLLLDDQLEADATQATLTQGFSLMTPDYASPEQARGEAVSPASDVYALGLVLYELLAEQQAQHIEKYTPLGIQQAVCDNEVPLPSKAAIPPALSGALRGDLDNILMKALQKEPERRYESAAALAADLDRYLRDEPVQARPDTTLYRARKFVRRNRLAVSAAAVMLLALGIGGGVAVRQSLIARASEREARQHEQHARALARDGLFEVFDAVRELPGSTEARRKIVVSASKYLESLAASNPTDPALLKELGEGYKRVADLQGADAMGGNLGDPAGAVVNYRRADSYLGQALQANPADLGALKTRARLLRDLADTEGQLHGPLKALEGYNNAAVSARALLKQYPGDRDARELVADLLLITSRKQRDANALAAAEQTALESLRVFESLVNDLPGDASALTSMAAAESAVGMTQSSLGRLQEALGHFRSGVARNQQAMELNPSNQPAQRNLMLAYNHLGEVQGNPDAPNLGDAVAAEASYREMVKLARQFRAADAGDVRAGTDLAFAELRLAAVLTPAQAAEKRALLDESLRLLRAQLERTPGNVVVSLNAAMAASYLGDVQRDAGAAGAAIAHYRESLRLAEGALPSGHMLAPATLVRSSAALAALLAQQGQGDEGLALLRRAEVVARGEATSAPSAAGEASEEAKLGHRVLLARVESAYATVYTLLRQSGPARQHREQALAAWREVAKHSPQDARARQEIQSLQALRP